MGAWIHPQPGSPLHDLAGDSILFVASGVDRPETALATSLDCHAFNNLLYQSNNYLAASGRYCRRPEIADDRLMLLSCGYIAPDSIQLSLIYSPDKNNTGLNYWTREFVNADIIADIISDDRQNRIFSGSFSGYLINRSPPYDTLRITNGRFDVTYGVTP